MADDPKGAIHTLSEGGVSGTHPSSDPLDLVLGPTTTDQFNTLRLGLLPIACWRVDDVRFAFDSSFVLPDVANEIRALAELRNRHKEPAPEPSSSDVPGFVFPPVAIFGHADPVGRDDYNKFLSGRRAAAIYGLLTRRDDVWEDLFSNTGIFAKPVAGDKWGKESLEIMRTTTGLPTSTRRRALFSAYMDFLCTLLGSDGKPIPDNKANPVRLELDVHRDFLGRGEDAHGKGDYQGCGEFNPLLIFSKEKNNEFEKAKDKTARNIANAPNRRVMALLFRPGSRVLFSKWPCPRAKEGTADCIKRFWSDGEKRRGTRRSNQSRKFEDTNDTFACRFYQRISDGSPCDGIFRTIRVRLFDRESSVLLRAPFTVTVAGRTVSGFTGPEGEALVRGVELPATCLVRWSRPSAQLDSKAPDPAWRDFEFEHTVSVILDTPDVVPTFAETSLPPGADSRRLSNMGYIFKDTPKANVLAFQRDAGLPQTGSLDDAASNIREQHDELIAPPKPFRGKGALSEQQES